MKPTFYKIRVGNGKIFLLLAVISSPRVICRRFGADIDFAQLEVEILGTRRRPT